MPQMQFPLVYGDSRSKKTLDYTQEFPVNMVPVTRPIKQANGYMRSWYGLSKVADVAGRSRGVLYNTYDNNVYRVMGTTLYRGSDFLATIAGVKRCKMAHSRNSVAVATDGGMKLYLYDGTVKDITNWPASSANPTNFNWGQIQDVIRLRGRYVWSQANSDTFWITSIQDESHPDPVAAFYRAESMPDGLLALRAYRDFVVCFGSSTIEFFGLTGDSNNVFAAQSAYMVNEGIAGQWAVTEYADTFAFLTGPASGVNTIKIMNASGGSAADVGNKQVKDVLAQYSANELSSAILESFATSDGEFLMVHLPNETLVYDAAASQSLGVQAWAMIRTGVADDQNYRAIDFCNEGSVVTCGDTIDAIKGQIDLSTSGQYGQDVEMILYTPLMNLAYALMSDLELDVSLGSENPIRCIFVSATEDGLVYGQERQMPYDSANRYNGRAHLLKIGRVRTNIGFKFRLVGTAPAYLSKCTANVT